MDKQESMDEKMRIKIVYGIVVHFVKPSSIYGSSTKQHVLKESDI